MSANRIEKEKNWQMIEDSFAADGSVAIVVVDEESSDLAKSNNNSMCDVLYNSEDFAPECAKFCGKAFDWATEAEKTVEYKCYAGLNCLAVPVKLETKQLVAIVGRTFMKADDYRSATTRAISGDWQKFPPTKFFENVLLSSSMRNLEKAAERLENLSEEEKTTLLQHVEESRTINKQKNIDTKTAEAETQNNQDSEVAPGQRWKIEKTETSPTEKLAELGEQLHSAARESAIVRKKLSRGSSKKAEEISEWRSLLSSLLNQSYLQACESILNFVSKRYELSSLAWLECKENRLETIFAVGELKTRRMRLNFSADDERLREAMKKEISLELRERQSAENDSAAQTIQLFPVTVGDEIRSALIVGDEIPGENAKRHISRFCRTIAPQLEILHLREELKRRGWLERAVQKFNESVKEIDTDEFWSSLAQIFAELMRAERSSLLVFDEKSNTLSAKAATGSRADSIKAEKGHLGGRVADKVMESGKPLVVEDVRKTRISDAPAERSYKSRSFISYPIMIGGRKIGVLNVTDRADGENYGEIDLEILDAIVPQFAVSIDRALLKHKAGEFEQLSVTDALTGLLNRRYLEERLAEEIKRSKRDGLEMSFMMIDVDDFKSYNDNFSHPEGDRALRLVAHCLKETLRGADVAARYGGEEFTILLPQTTSDEARIIGERLRERVATTEFPNRKVTISVGVASCSDDICTAPKIIKAADDAVYEAKRRGRNNVQVFEDL